MYDGFYSFLKTKKASLHTLENTFIGGKLLGLLFLGFGLYSFRGAQWRTLRTMMTPIWTRQIFVFNTILRVYYTDRLYICFIYTALPPLPKFVNWSGNIEIGYSKFIWDDCLDDFQWVFGFPMPPKFSNGRSWTWLLFVYITTKLRSCKRL